MLWEATMLNRLYKSNEFGRIKPRMLKDRVIFVITDSIKFANQFGKAQEKEVSISEKKLLEYFNIDHTELALKNMIKSIFNFMNCILHINHSKYVNKEVKIIDSQILKLEFINHSEEKDIKDWVKKLYISLIVTHETIQQSFAQIDKYLLLRSTMVLHKLSLADIFLLTMLRRTHNFMKKDCSYNYNNYKNIMRLLNWMIANLSTGFEELEIKENKLYQNLTQLTSSAEFIKAIRNSDIQEAQQILNINEKAIKSIDTNSYKLKSALHIAVQYQNFKLVEFLLKQKHVDINVQDKESQTPIYYAIEAKNLELVKYLAENGANLEHKEALNRTPLYFAASLGVVDVLKYLIEKKCDVNVASSLGRTALVKAAWNGVIEAVKVLLSHPDIIVDCPDSNNRTPLHNACWGQYGGRLRQKSSYNPYESPECALMLLERGANPNALDIQHLSPLAIACGTGGQKCIDLLVKYGADINQQSLNGSTPLHGCFYRGNIDCLETLIKYRPDTSIKSQSGFIPLEDCFIDNMYEILKYVIEQNFDDPNLQVNETNIQRLIQIALEFQAKECLEVLIKHFKEQMNKDYMLNLDFVHIFLQLPIKKENEVKTYQMLELLFTELNSLMDIPYEKIHSLMCGFCIREPNDILDRMFDKVLEVYKQKSSQLPLWAVKTCCYMKNSEYLQKILENFSVFDLQSLLTTIPEEYMKIFEYQEIMNHNFYEWAKNIEIPKFREMFQLFEGYTPLHIAIIKNSYQCTKLLLEETNLDAFQLAVNNETSVQLACKCGVSIEILEKLLISLRTIWPIEQVKEFLDKTNDSGIRAYDYCKAKKRRDLAIVLEEFVDTSKSVLEIQFEYLNYDFKNTVKTVFQKQIQIIQSLDTVVQYTPLQEPFLKSNLKQRLDKCLEKQIKPLKFTPFQWIDNIDQLNISIDEIKSQLQECNLLAVDLEYHNFAKHTSIVSLVQMSTYCKDYIIDTLRLKDNVTEKIRDIFQNPQIIKIFHGCDSDLQLLASDLDIMVVNVFDTARAYQFIQKLPDNSPKHINLVSLETLCDKFLNTQIDKFFQVADWRISRIHFIVFYYKNIFIMIPSQPMFHPELLKGKVAIVTGGSRGGMLKEIAKQFLIYKAKAVVLMSRNAEKNGAVAKELCEFGICHSEPGDVRKADDCKRVIQATIDKFGSIDILVNGAAGNFLASASKISPNGFKTVMEIDAMGVFNMSQNVFNSYMGEKGGVIINISATLHWNGSALQVHSAAAKAAIDAMTKTMAVECYYIFNGVLITLEFAELSQELLKEPKDLKDQVILEI